MAILGDLTKALGQFGDRRFQWVFLKGLLLSFALLALITAGAVWLVTFLPDPLFTLPWIGPVGLPALGLQTLALGGMLLASAFLMFPVTAVFIGLFLDEIADAVEAKHYPDNLAPRSPGLIEGALAGLGFAGTVLIANLIATVAYLLLAPLAPVIFIALNGYLLGREFFETIAIRHLPAREVKPLRRRFRLRIWLAGALIAIPLSVPVLNLIVPVLGVATMTHQYHRLAARRLPQP